MQAREYLSQIRKLDVFVNQRIQEKNSLRASMLNLSAADPSREHVQGGKHSSDDRIVNILHKLSRMEREIDALIDELADKKHKIIEQIQTLENPVYSQLLYKRYIEGKRLDVIAKEINYSFSSVCKMHGRALCEFEMKCQKMKTNANANNVK